VITSLFDCHAHTCYSNIRLLDCINRPTELIDRAIELGLSGIAITDHEALCSHIIVNKYAKELQETHPEFTVALGNEIYLTDTRDSNQKYYHFILLAKDEIGYRGLKELSSIAWYNVYTDRRMERVPTLKSELANVIKKYKGHIIGTSACMGGELSTNLYALAIARKVGDKDRESEYYNKALNFINYCIDVFGADDFYIECAPSTKPDQVITNKQLLNVAKAFNLKMIVGGDAHYLKKEDRYVHKAYLNSKGGEREVDDFYEFTYVQTPDEVRAHLKEALNDEDIDWIFENSLEVKNKIQFYSLEKHQHIPEVEVLDYPIGNHYNLDAEKYPHLYKLTQSENIQERYWINQCCLALTEKGLFDDERYLNRLNEEARVKSIIGEKLDTCMFAYPNTL
jgi:DNA polymerase-3 subunit alpha